MEYLKTHSDPKVRAIAADLQRKEERRNRILKLVQEALSQLRLEIKAMTFDLECTRQERDEARGKA